MMLKAVKEIYLLFPIFNEKHWTLLVLDTENGSWKFYNSMRPSTETDNHLNEANKVVKHQLITISSIPLVYIKFYYEFICQTPINY